MRTFDQRTFGLQEKTKIIHGIVVWPFAVYVELFPSIEVGIGNLGAAHLQHALNLPPAQQLCV
jgi:hypothetical protein